jgi:hypothetical protein
VGGDDNVEAGMSKLGREKTRMPMVLMSLKRRAMQRMTTRK